MQIRHLIRVTGIVQGVGFRPFVYRLAQEHALTGFVLNDGEGVFLEVEGEPAAQRAFLRDLKEKAPAAARIDSVQDLPVPPVGYVGFEIRRSRESAQKTAPVSPDLAACPACLNEMRDPKARRYHYPFTNCTHCGPRFSIIRDVPYDRAETTMATFRMCPECQAEYDDPTDRRFHAQPIACPHCGPILTLYTAAGARIPSRNVLQEVRRLLRQGFIVAIKGLGGYHLAVDAGNELAVRTLRNRKFREEKPFALMARDLAAIKAHAHVTAGEARLLRGVEAPIVLLRRRRDCRLPDAVAPGQAYLGFFLPYSPLHHLLFLPEETGAILPDFAVSETGIREFAPDPIEAEADGGAPQVLVLTSGNRADEPIAYQDQDALERLAEIADYFLLHNRAIHLRCDDSVVRMAGGTPQILRRSRGYAPRGKRLPWPVPAHVLAVGPLFKNTFALAKGIDCYVGPHVGDLENLDTFRAFEEGIRHYERLFDIRPSVVAYDLHPDYLSTRFALSLDMEAAIPCQHHEAHIASVMGEHGCDGPVIGVAFDGTGYGADGTIWGGEFFVVRDRVFQRAAHLRPVPLPGGDKAAREPWRAAVAYLRQAMDPESEVERARLFPGVERQSLALVERMLDRRLNSPVSSGAGRAFDAAAYLILGRVRAAYEGQAPLELEQCALSCPRPSALSPLPFALLRQQEPWLIDLAPAFAELARLLGSGATNRAELAMRFHQSLGEAISEVVILLAEREKIRDVCLSGGVFQNQILCGLIRKRLLDSGLRIYRNLDFPANDGGISFGQVVLASWRAFSDATTPSS